MADTAVCSVAPTMHSTGDMLISSSLGKRKTPSELRLEQLKRLHHDPDQATCSSDSNSRASTFQKRETAKPPRFVETRVPDIYAAAKPGDRGSRFLAKDKKDLPPFPPKCTDKEPGDNVISTVGDRARSLEKFQWKNAEPPNSSADMQEKNECSEQHFSAFSQKSGSAPFSKFRDVTQISSVRPDGSSVPTLDMAKAFKGMSAPKGFLPTASSGLQSSRHVSASNLKTPTSLHIEDVKFPLDLSLKTGIRFTSSFSFDRCQRLTNRDLFTGMQAFITTIGTQVNNESESSKMPLEASFSEALHSWVHPQSVFPASVLSALASSAAHGGTAEREFLSKRQQMWEDSFRSLYYMFRDGNCGLFYFSTQQFLVMFIQGEDKKTCRAYITRSTRGLRALLQEQDISFTMPLCLTQVDTNIEDIQELTEFEKSNPGQTRLVDSMVSIDNSPESVLEFSGHRNVHGIYDFLLNHRSLLSSTTGADVPLLYSPVSFQNASLVMPEVVCKQLQRASEDFLSKQAIEPSMESNYLLEIKGGVLPPWVVWRVCTAVRKIQSGSFEATFTTDPLSGGLNIAQGVDSGSIESNDSMASETNFRKEMKDLFWTPNMRDGFIKNLKHLDGSYDVTLSSTV